MRDNLELTLSLVVALVMAGVYVLYELLASPAGGHPFGHALGILGTILMVMTEVLYSARKRWHVFRFGQVRHWLSFHIFTGIVGPTLVLTHTALEFRGLAGVTMGLTALVVASGFLGRYIYTAVPRTLAGVEIDRRSLELQAARQAEALMAWSADKPQRLKALVQASVLPDPASGESAVRTVLGRAWQERTERAALHNELRRLDREERKRAAEIEKLLRQQRRLVRQMESLQAVRRLMGVWHMVHVPLGLTLFTAVTVHIVAALYYKGI
jgi:hypothetical protein